MTITTPTVTPAPEDTTAPARLPLIGDQAPQFEADSTHGRIRLSDYAGHWVVLFSHPADFTPVCTTEFVAFTELADEFTARNVALLGNSVDSVHSHLAWTHAIHEKTGIRIPFPIIADLDTAVSRAYGMLHPHTSQTAAVRAVFAIDPDQTIRAVVYYPMNVGRMIPEILRLIDALQTSDRDSVSCPANWRPGDEIVVAAPRTEAELDARLSDTTLTLTDWYLASRPDRSTVAA